MMTRVNMSISEWEIPGLLQEANKSLKKATKQLAEAAQKLEQVEKAQADLRVFCEQHTTTDRR